MKGTGDLKVVVACGGTGGHAFPGLAVAEVLRQRGHEVTVWDSGRDIESSVMKSWTGNIFSTGARQLRLSNFLHIINSYFRCLSRLKKERCDVLLAMGSYSSLTPVIAARSRGVPVVLHEANTVPGRAVEFLSRLARAVAISFESTQKYLQGRECFHTGLPVRSNINKGVRFDSIPENAFVIFVTGGSQGAHAVNELASEAIVRLARKLKEREQSRPIYVIHQTGSADESRVIMTYATNGIEGRIKAFEDRMEDAMASADFVIARAGASTCFELALCGKSALFIPLPSAVRNHQHFNAEAFVAARGADEAFQQNLSPLQLERYLLSIYDNEERRKSMSENIKKLSVLDAAERVADIVERMAKA
ncbi:MAG: UDP-N-acetylglucosamine--N-acetylmuramyl-(pentapeptide) pyrophosphoryl-undecaprenol N-acetylglucosamine transferase [Kiritimatiellae bacterium]|nr:UDP-N-acetylglucosamine--N-acetylmuramyl-(pentapeptide) pyrophosphoryl-undecaprenol N-acetylglucosamine transferase [Kiritimatiellia bacterium]